MNPEKIKTYIGFAVRSGKIIFGTDNLLGQRKVPKIILTDPGLGDNSREKLMRYAERKGIFIAVAKIGEYLPGRNCKALGMTEPNLAEAVKKELKESYGV